MDEYPKMDLLQMIGDLQMNKKLALLARVFVSVCIFTALAVTMLWLFGNGRSIGSIFDAFFATGIHNQILMVCLVVVVIGAIERLIWNALVADNEKKIISLEADLVEVREINKRISTHIKRQRGEIDALEKRDEDAIRLLNDLAILRDKLGDEISVLQTMRTVTCDQGITPDGAGSGTSINIAPLLSSIGVLILMSDNDEVDNEADAAVLRVFSLIDKAVREGLLPLDVLPVIAVCVGAVLDENGYYMKDEGMDLVQGALELSPQLAGLVT